MNTHAQSRARHATIAAAAAANSAASAIGESVGLSVLDVLNDGAMQAERTGPVGDALAAIFREEAGTITEHAHDQIVKVLDVTKDGTVLAKAYFYIENDSLRVRTSTTDIISNLAYEIATNGMIVTTGEPGPTDGPLRALVNESARILQPFEDDTLWSLTRLLILVELQALEALAGLLDKVSESAQERGVGTMTIPRDDEGTLRTINDMKHIRDLAAAVIAADLTPSA